MNHLDKLNLQKMINANNVEDCTEDIREKKHSRLIKQDLNSMLFLKNKYSKLMKEDPVEFENICIKECQFLFNNYTDIYNKIRKDELDLQLFNKFLGILKMIEDGELDQHSGSYQVGNILKEIYIDSALRKSKHLDDVNGNLEERHVAEVKNISWNQWKLSNSSK
jgi:hypothetical protein